MGLLPNINMSEFGYNLPDDRIAKYPASERDSSKLLVYRDAEIQEYLFCNLPEILPENGLILFNNTKVIHARLQFRKETGAAIEIFCLEPTTPSDYQISLSAQQSCTWKCLIGNKKKWKKDALKKLFRINNRDITLSAEIVSDTNNESLIRFSWDTTDCSFAEILEHEGEIPLPPYLNRNAEPSDTIRYQTVYSRFDGSVAAPTAGLHFTDTVLAEISRKNITCSELTLHVGAGTFKPVSESNVENHTMHREHFSVSVETLNQIRNNLGNITITGTTSLRAVESLYWLAGRIQRGETAAHLSQWEPYTFQNEISAADAIDILLEYCQKQNIAAFSASTSVMILPGYQFRFADRLITNFHQPKSTMLLLVAAFIGNDWKKVYDGALNHNFRFLSYGDSSLLFKANNWL